MVNYGGIVWESAGSLHRWCDLLSSSVATGRCHCFLFSSWNKTTHSYVVFETLLCCDLVLRPGGNLTNPKQK